MKKELGLILILTCNLYTCSGNTLSDQDTNASSSSTTTLSPSNNNELNSDENAPLTPDDANEPLVNNATEEITPSINGRWLSKNISTEPYDNLFENRSETGDIEISLYQIWEIEMCLHLFLI